ncbi:MAG: type I-E CRISPR-associated protein Cas5/CasD [Ignavibacteriae bacterium]|nr:type I-E CRISPR-associated protein Cas5/CasD [Ignavibacteriota bacterium]
MRSYLIFRCYGPLASWGDIAVGEHRRSYAHPSKSAILGLVAAALGIRRGEEQKLHELREAFGLALCVENEGVPLRDYHTIQTPSAGSGPHRTRREELAVDPAKINTLLSAREYRCDALSLVALWDTDNASWPLETVRDALREPIFTLYLGRKSCPPAYPLNPHIITASVGVHEAFLTYIREHHMLTDTLTREENTLRIFSDANADPISGKKQFERIRRDLPHNRGRWQFAERIEHCTVLPRPLEDTV